MRIRIKDGRWYDSNSTVHVTDKLRFTRRGNWVYHRLADGEVVEEAEAVEIMLLNGRSFEDCPGFGKLPQNVRDQLDAYLDAEYSPGDEV